MKKITLSLLLCALCGSLSAQPPITTDLKLRLEGSSFNPNGAAAAIWNDLSGFGNSVTALNAGTAEPTAVSNAGSTGLPGVRFDGTADVMTRLAANTTGFINPNATVFVVRVANTAYTTLNGPVNAQWNVMLAIGQNNTFNNDFSLMGNWANHSSSSGNWRHRDHPCYPSLPDCTPAVLAGVFRPGIGAGDLDYYVNNVISTNAPGGNGTATAYTSAGRGIAVGATWGATPNTIAANTYFQGTILEILAYDRVLTLNEIHQVNQYLMNKYSVWYGCSSTQCDPDFSWSMSTTSPNTYTFQAQHPNLPYKYEWTINGGPVVSTQPSFTTTFPVTPIASYKVCLTLRNCNGQALCSQCFDLCHGDMGNSTAGCAPHFEVSGNTNTPMQVTLSPFGLWPIGTTFFWEAFNTPITSPAYYSSLSLTATVPVSTAGPYHTFRMSTNPAPPGGCYRYSGNHCFFNNAPSPYRLVRPQEDARPMQLSIVPNPASDQVTLQLSNTVEDKLAVQVTDMSGRVLYRGDVQPGSNSAKISLEHFSPGMYLVQMQGGNVSLNGKFIRK